MAIGKHARAGICRDNVLRTTTLAIVDDLGSGVRVEDNIPVYGGRSVVGHGLPGPAPRVSAKRRFRKGVGGIIEQLTGGYPGQIVSILTETSFRVLHSARLVLSRARDMVIARRAIVSFVMRGEGWHEIV
jgi:hypothetical protein